MALSNHQLLLRCNTCKRRDVSLSGETSFCVSCRSSSTMISRDEEASSSSVPESMMRVSPRGVASNNVNVDIGVHKQAEEQVETAVDSITIIDLCSEEDEDLTTSAGTTSATLVVNDNHTQLKCKGKVQPKAVSSCTSMLDSSYNCVVCGSSLQHIATLQGRVFHLKNCSKKHGIKASDFKKGDEEIEGDELTLLTHKTTTSTQQQSTIANFFKNPYKITTSMQQQSTITNFFKDPAPGVTTMRSVNHVLIDNAKRLAKCNEIARLNKDSKTSLSKKRPATTPWRGGALKKHSNTYCPLYKRITGTDLICDGFHYANPTLSTNYFLSHFHFDHYGGLTSSWDAGTIYCSVVTANLVHQQLGVDKKFLRPLELLTPTVIESRGKAITVTLLDANHCPGAVMFLFQIGSSKTSTILHVGDFRWNRETMLQKSSPLLPFSRLKDVRLDELFLDTTYCEEKYANIPSQQEAIDAAMEIIEKELADCAKRRLKPLLLFGSYTIGKERLYLEICERLKLKAMVDKRRYDTLAALNLPQHKMRILTTNKSETFVRIVPLPHINFKHMPSYAASADNKALSKPYDCIIGFRPTGWTFS